MWDLNAPTAWRAVAFLLLIRALCATPALAGPPFIVDDPVPVDYGHWEVYFFSTYSHTGGVDAAQLPAVEINHGALPNLQLHILTPLAFEREPGGHPHYGYGDTELGAKYRFIQETDWLPQVATFPAVEIPTGDSKRGLGNGRVQVFVPFWFQKSFGKDKEWTTDFGGGYWYNPGADHRDYFRFGWQLQRDFGPHITFGGEIYHETPSAERALMPTLTGNMPVNVVGSKGHTAFNLGGYYNIDDHNHLLFSAGRDIDGPNRFSCYLGYQITF